jgi:hypothetical protein
MSELTDFLNKFENFKNYQISEYDKIKLVKITIGTSNKPLVIVPPYSFDGLAKMMKTIDSNFSIIKKNYNIIYMMLFQKVLLKSVIICC